MPRAAAFPAVRPLPQYVGRLLLLLLFLLLLLLLIVLLLLLLLLLLLRSLLLLLLLRSLLLALQLELSYFFLCHPARVSFHILFFSSASPLLRKFLWVIADIIAISDDVVIPSSGANAICHQRFLLWQGSSFFLFSQA
jgi:hypothetical protein